MTLQLTSRAMRALSLWIDGRLNERKAVEWAATLVRRTQGSLSRDTTQLIRFLADKAGTDAELNADHRTVWRLMSVAAAEQSDTNNQLVGFHLAERIKNRNFSYEDVEQLVNFVRPRLSVEPVPQWYAQDENRASKPLRWVHWEFKAQSRSIFYSAAHIGRAELVTLSPQLLRDILESSTIALKLALRQATELGWITPASDVPSVSVRSVVEPPNASSYKEHEKDDDHDPDLHADGFAPIVRLMTAAYDVLVGMDARNARSCSNQWDDSEGLVIRLAAFARWFENAYNGTEVAAFLIGLDDDGFWRASKYPEIATLRARRWADLPAQMRQTLANKLTAGPSNEALRAEADTVYTKYLRDYEIARIVDQGQKVPQAWPAIIAKRRNADHNFPKHIPATEIAKSGVSFSRGQDGDASKFSGFEGVLLLRNLDEANRRDRFDFGEDARALASSLDGRTRILLALQAAQPSDLGYQTGWETLLSYAPPKGQETANPDDKLIVALASLALRLDENTFAMVAARLCYWIEVTEETYRNFEHSTPLWLRLLPHASQAASEATDRDDDEADLTSEALNEPLGHLISFYLRRCPNIPAKGEKPGLPEPFTSALKALSGRAALLMANRMALTMNYFERADRDWLHSLVVSKLLEDSRASNQLWEAFAKYGRVPSPGGWNVLADRLLSKVVAGTLSPESLKRLVEMAVIVWAWSKQGSDHKISSTALRSTLSLATDSIRAVAASQVSSFFRDSERSQADTWQNLGEPFMREVWPHEPMLQSGNTSKELASVPVLAGIEYFRDALNLVAPYLVSFEVWSVHSAFSLELKSERAQKLVRTHPEGVLSLLASSIDERQKHQVFDLTEVLEELKKADPAIDRDARFRKLRRLAS